MKGAVAFTIILYGCSSVIANLRKQRFSGIKTVRCPSLGNNYFLDGNKKEQMIYSGLILLFLNLKIIKKYETKCNSIHTIENKNNKNQPQNGSDSAGADLPLEPRANISTLTLSFYTFTYKGAY